MKKTIIIFFLLVVALNFFLLPVVFAQTQQLTNEEWVVVTIAGLISSVVVVGLTNLVKKLSFISNIEGSSSVISLVFSFGVVWLVDKFVATHLPLATLWFLTLNLQTLAQVGYSMKPNLAKK